MVLMAYLFGVILHGVVYGREDGIGGGLGNAAFCRGGVVVVADFFHLHALCVLAIASGDVGMWW